MQCLRKRVATSYGGITRIRSMGRRAYLPLSLLTQAPQFLFLILFMNKKTEDTHTMSPKESNYDSLRRHYPHQVPGSKFDDFLSACNTSSP